MNQIVVEHEKQDSVQDTGRIGLVNRKRICKNGRTGFHDVGADVTQANCRAGAEDCQKLPGEKTNAVRYSGRYGER